MLEIVEKMKTVAGKSWQGLNLTSRVKEMPLPNEVKEQVIFYLESTL
jgi:hypothetical protein